MKTYKLLIFDWDGTLMDTKAAIIKSVQAVADDLCLAKPSPKAIRNTIGLNLIDQCEQLFPDTDHQLFIQEYRKHYNNYYHEMSFFNGAIETLRYLKQHYSLAIATSKSRPTLERILNDHQLSKLFSSIRCGDDGYPKPDPRMLLTILDELAIPQDDAVMIGDSEFDMQLANKAGVDVIAATYGAQNKDQLTRYNPAAYINNIKELIGFLKPGQ